MCQGFCVNDQVLFLGLSFDFLVLRIVRSALPAAPYVACAATDHHLLAAHFFLARMTLYYAVVNKLGSGPEYSEYSGAGEVEISCDCGHSTCSKKIGATTSS